MHTAVDMSIWALISNASLLVMLIMLLLLSISFVVWVLIFHKLQILKRAKWEAKRFEKQFWSGNNLVDLYKTISQRREKPGGLANIFEAGFREYANLHKQPDIQPEAVLEGAQRAMRVAVQRELEVIESSLSFLATAGSTSPYIGLLGTVWGIMNSFRALGGVEQASMAMVAPGIAEALIATAMGLFAAIPAVVAFNYFSQDIERLEGRFDLFMEEFSSVLHRQIYNR